MARILLSAYACEPGKGSEPQVGWLWATELADAGHEVWALTRESNRAAIEGELPRRGRKELHFVYFDLPKWAQWWKHSAIGLYLYYALWQWGAYRLAKATAKWVAFDWVQHVTFVGLRGPSFMGWLGVPFLLGPVSGGEVVPRQLRRGMGLRARVWEELRDVGNFLLRHDPLMRSCFRQARLILLATKESKCLVPARFHGKCRVQLGIGLSREFLAWTGAGPQSQEPALRLLFAGRLVEWKGIAIALRAVTAARRRGAAVQFTIVGSGPAEAGLRRLAKELGLDDAIRWRKWVPQSELLEQYQAHDALLFPSLRDSGGMVVLEALAHGLPVVCTDRGGPGVIVTPRCGRVVATAGRNREQLAAAIAAELFELQRNRWLLQQLRRGARSRAWQFDFHRAVILVYSELTATEKLAFPGETEAPDGNGTNSGWPRTRVVKPAGYAHAEPAFRREMVPEKPLPASF